MPTTPDRQSAIDIFNKSTFEARVAIGQRQAIFKHPVEPGAQQTALDQLKSESVLIESPDKIDLAPPA